VLLIDEVLAVGDEGFQLKCFNKIGELKKTGVTVILVSHNMHIVSTFTEKAVILNKGKVCCYESSAEAAGEYLKLFYSQSEQGIEKICSGNEVIKFKDIKINKRNFIPTDTFSISLGYESELDYQDTEIDVAILASNEPSAYFQATNKAYGGKIGLPKGRNRLSVDIEDIRINNANAKIAIAVWSNGREELLFWWRVPVQFSAVKHSTGKVFLNVSYKVTRGEEVYV
jgi:lipopolysaccharide transport system ATP-binding protein